MKEIYNNLIKLKNELYIIHCKNWIPNLGKGKSSSGKTLEELLNKKEDNLILPDYNGIEIKVRNENNKYPIHLFSCALDNKPNQMKELLKIGGYPDKNNKNYNVFQVSINSLNKKRIRSYSYKLVTNQIKQVLELRIYYGTSNRILKIMSWSYKELKLRLESKLKYLAIVFVKRYYSNNKYFFKYEIPIFYELSTFENFINLIKDGYITISFKLTYNHTKEKFGEFLDKGTSFDIDFKHIELLYKKIDL